MDTSDPDISFDDKGYCNHCKQVEQRLKTEPHSLKNDEKQRLLEKLADNIKSDGSKKKYDCIIGLSGGVDSTYTAYVVKKILGLRPLAVHFDNGWNSELANSNIENICNNLGIDLFTYVVNWDEYKDIQLSFLKASTPDSEIPTDHAIVALLHKQALRWSARYILVGHNVATESITPKSWSQGHFDWRYIRGIQKKFGSKKLKTFPHFSMIRYLWWRNVRKIRWVSLLDYVDYKKEEAKKLITDQLSWRDYGGKHHESLYTRIYQSYILPQKFGFDKRRAHFSSLIMAGQISRDEALAELKKPSFDSKKIKEDVEYLTSKFNISNETFAEIMKSPVRSYYDYPNYFSSWYYRYLELAIKVKKKFLG